MWKTLKLIDIVNIEIGKTPFRKNPKFWDKNKTGSNIWLSIRDISNNNGLYIDDSSEYISDEGAKLFKEIPKNTLIMSFKLSIGKLAITKKSLRTNEAIAAFKIKDTNLVSNKYLYYFLSSINWDRLAGYDIKVKGKTLNKAKLKEILITFPTVEEQQRIVAKLDVAFSEIDKTILSKQNSIINLDKFFQTKIDTFFQDNSNNWEDTTLGKYYDVRDGTHDSPKYVDQGIPLVTSKNLKKGKIDLTKIKYIKNEDYLKIKKRSEVSVGDVLMAMIGTIGNPVIVEKDNNFAIKNVALFKIKQNQSSDFLKFYLSSSFVINKMIKEAKGTTQKFVGLGYLRDFPIKIPSYKKQKEISLKIKEIERNVEILNNKYNLNIRNYISLKNSLLSELLNKNKAA